MSHRLAGRSAALGALGTLGAVLVLAASAQAATLHGVVVHANHRAHSFAVALPTGRLVAIHSSRSPVIGSTVSVSAALLRNGTYGAQRITIGARVRNARIRGVVTFVDRRHGAFTVSADGTSLLVRPRHAARAAAASTLPAVGEDVSVEVEIDDQGDLTDQSVQQTGAQTTGIDLEGTVLAIDPTARTLSISADDSEESGQSLTVVVPAAIDLSMFAVGEDVELTATMQTDGTFLLQGASGDQNQQQANNPNDQQGCQGDGGDSSGQSTSSNLSTCPNSGDQGNSGTTSND